MDIVLLLGAFGFRHRFVKKCTGIDKNISLQCLSFWGNAKITELRSQKYILFSSMVLHIPKSVNFLPK
jgi:hypothetical protein